MDKKIVKLELTQIEYITLESALALLHNEMEKNFGKALLDKNEDAVKLFSASVDSIISIHKQIQNGAGIAGGVRGLVKRVLKGVLSRL